MFLMAHLGLVHLHYAGHGRRHVVVVRRQSAKTAVSPWLSAAFAISAVVCSVLCFSGTTQRAVGPAGRTPGDGIERVAAIEDATLRHHGAELHRVKTPVFVPFGEQ
jgi:hypothetical protein